MNPVAYLFMLIFGAIGTVISIYGWAVIIYIILNLLIQLQIINPYKPFLKHYTIGHIHSFLARIIEPALRKIRRFVPYLGSIDLSPIVLIILVHFAEYTIGYVGYHLFLK